MPTFHNMALISPDTTEADMDYHAQTFCEVLKMLLGKKSLSGRVEIARSHVLA